MTAQEQIKLLIRQGLYRKNLLDLIGLCESLVSGKPGIYGSLICIFRLLEQEYEPHGAIDTARYDSVNALLGQSVIGLIDAENQSAYLIFQCLDNVQAAVEALSH